MNAEPKAPKHLRPATKAWWLEVCQQYELRDHHRMLLTLAAEAYDRTAQAREILAKDGIVIGQASLRPHPCIAIERDARLAFARLVAQLSLDEADQPVIDEDERAVRRSTRPEGWRKTRSGQAHL